MYGLSGTNVLVTGGTSGIGQAIAIRFAREGANVAINYRKRPEDAAETADQVHQCQQQVRGCGVKDVLVRGDVSDEQQVDAMVDQAAAELGGLDILINNAGIQTTAASHEMSTEDLDAVLDVNLRGAFLCARRALRHFLDQQKAGSIINVSSVHQLIPKPRFVGYSMSKGGMQNLTRTLALEYAKRGIRVNAIAPGATITPINRGWADDPEKKRQVAEHIPMGRAGTAEEMAGVAAFLASEQAAYMTGQTLFVDGGLSLYPDFRTPWSSE